jgi:hypothetical protein
MYCHSNTGRSFLFTHHFSLEKTLCNVNVIPVVTFHEMATICICDASVLQDYISHLEIFFLNNFMRYKVKFLDLKAKYVMVNFVYNLF